MKAIIKIFVNKENKIDHSLYFLDRQYERLLFYIINFMSDKFEVDMNVK